MSEQVAIGKDWQPHRPTLKCVHNFSGIRIIKKPSKLIDEVTWPITVLRKVLCRKNNISYHKKNKLASERFPRFRSFSSPFEKCSCPYLKTLHLQQSTQTKSKLITTCWKPWGINGSVVQNVSWERRVIFSVLSTRSELGIWWSSSPCILKVFKNKQTHKQISLHKYKQIKTASAIFRRAISSCILQKKSDNVDNKGISSQRNFPLLTKRYQKYHSTLETEQRNKIRCP